jgi:hypothetical protein
MIGPVVTGGYGTFGSVNLVVTDGYTSLVAPAALRLRFPYQIRTSRGYGSSRQSMAVNASASGDNVVVSGVAGKRIAVLAYVLSAAAPVDAKWRSSGGDLTGPFGMATGKPIKRDHDPDGMVITDVGGDLILSLSGVVSVGGHITYTVLGTT